MLICLEGLDKSGKSTLSRALVDQLPGAILTKEPGSLVVEGNSELRRMVLNDPSLTPVERELLFYVDASKHRRFIQSNEDKIIISDRGLWSHLAYLDGYLKTKQIDFDQFSLCKKLIRYCSAVPSIIFYIKSSLELMKERQALMAESKDVIEDNGDDFYRAVMNKYNDLAGEQDHIGPTVYTLNATTPIDLNVKTMVALINSWRIQSDEHRGNS